MFKKIRKLLKFTKKMCYNVTQGELEMKNMNKTYSALDVARYVVNYANENNMIISNLKLQKILYFIQMEFLIQKKNIVCFKDDIEAWDFGPVVSEVYQEFKKYGALNIPPISYVYDDSNGLLNLKKIKYESHICDKDKEIINNVINECNEFSASQLVEITHNQSPWINAYSSGKNSVISISSLIDFINNLPGENANG